MMCQGDLEMTKSDPNGAALRHTDPASTGSLQKARNLGITASSIRAPFAMRH